MRSCAGQTTSHHDARMRMYAMEDGGETTYYTWDENGLNLLTERDAQGNVTAEYTHGHSPVDGAGTTAAARKQVDGCTYYQYPDKNGHHDTVTISNAAGVVTHRYTCNAWGELVHEQVTRPAAPNSLIWQANWLYLKEGVYKSAARLYLADVGRFLQRDPKARQRSSSRNAYAYVGDHPITYGDPDGAEWYHYIPVVGSIILAEQTKAAARGAEESRRAAEEMDIILHNRLSYRTVQAPRVGPCGELRMWAIRWLLRYASPNGGHIVQHIQLFYYVQDCTGVPVRDARDNGRNEFWEGWRINPGRKITAMAEAGRWADDMYVLRYRNPIEGLCRKGWVLIRGTARFHERLTRLPAHFRSRNPQTNAGILPSTARDPKLVGGTPDARHSIVLIWNCCPDPAGRINPRTHYRINAP